MNSNAVTYPYPKGIYGESSPNFSSFLNFEVEACSFISNETCRWDVENPFKQRTI